MAVAAKSVLCIFLMVLCFTTGRGLRCHNCRGKYRTPGDYCDMAGINHTSALKLCTENDVNIWNSYLIKFREKNIIVDNLPLEDETRTDRNMACMKRIFGNTNHGVTDIEKTCSHRKFGSVDGCNMEKLILENIRPGPDITDEQLRELDVFKEKIDYDSSAQCFLCYTDGCNATIGLTPIFFIYPPLLLLFCVIWKLFFQ